MRSQSVNQPSEKPSGRPSGRRNNVTHRLWNFTVVYYLMNATLRSVFEDMLAMILQKHRVRFGELFWQGNRMAFEGREVLLQRRLWVMSFQPPAENNTKLFVESDHAGIEGSIVQAGQAQAISWVQSLSGKISPWLDMAGHQQARHVDAGNAAPNPIRIQERLTEKLLAASSLSETLCLGYN